MITNIPAIGGGRVKQTGGLVIYSKLILTTLVATLALTLGQTAQGKSSHIIVPHKHLTIAQTIKWQHRIIRHDLWVIRTAKFHKPQIVKWHRAQLKWTRRELNEILANRGPSISQYLLDAFTCIHGYEGAWNANTGNGYYGGLQMDLTFQGLYGTDFIKRWGTANKWPIWAQLQAAVRAYNSGRGFYPWPNTARACGLI